MLHYLFSWRGRISRASMWLFLLIAAVAYAIAVGAFAAVIQYDQARHPHAPNDPATTGTVIGMLFGIGLIFLPVFALLLYCSLAVMAKRLHDRNKSAWWVLIFVAGPAVISGVAASVAENGGASVTAASGGAQ